MVAEICDAIGRAKLAALLGVKKSAISNAVVAGQFPANWFDIVEREALLLGGDCPRSLFAFKRRPDADQVDNAA